MTHLVTPKLGELIGVGGTLLMETPLFLLQATSPSYFNDFLFHDISLLNFYISS